MDIKQTNISEIDTCLGSVDLDQFASRLCHQIPRYINWQPDPHAWIVDGFQINWTHLRAYTFPPFALIGSVLAKVMRDKCTLIIITLLWPSQPWYTHLLRMSIQDPIFIPHFQIFWQTQIRTNTHRVRQHCPAEGLSNQTINLPESSQRVGTLHHYKMGWQKWSRLCLLWKIDSVSAGVNFVLEFLSKLVSEGQVYRIFNGYRSALSAYHDKAERIPIMHHPKVCQLL